MKITKSNLDKAAAEHIISAEQAEQLFIFLGKQPNTAPGFNFTHLLYYLGGLIAIGAMTLFMNLGWEAFGGWGIVAISAVYAGLGIALTNRFQNKGLAIPAGICAAFVVALTPLAIYGLQQAFGVWPDDSVYREYHRYIKWHWIQMELGTLAVAAIVAWKYKHPFLVLPVGVTLWYMSMDVAVMLAGNDAEFETRALISMYFGLAMVLFAFYVDIKTRKSADYAFWLYIFGVMAFWGGMTAQESVGELAKFIYFCVNILMMGVGVLLVRRVFVIFGAIGVCIYLGHLASTIFEDSWLFPMALSAIGFFIICLGVLWQKHEQAITTATRRFLPAALREMLDSREG